MTTITIPRHTSPPSTPLARLVCRDAGVPVSWDVDLQTDTVRIDLRGTSEVEARAIVARRLAVHGIAAEVTP